jgi:GDP-L-fucose synthase
MNSGGRIFVAGHLGLVGSALVRRLQRQGYTDLILRTRAELDLTNETAVRKFFAEEHPAYVFLAAAKVGGILANDSSPVDFLRENLLIQNNVIHEAYTSGVERLLFLGSSCVYPKNAPQPIKEEYLLSGPLEPTNRAYALAKISGIEMCWAYNRQYGTRSIAAMPTNLYGPNDNYNLHTSHVVPALIKKFHQAKLHHARTVTIWGSGTPRREFLFSDDAADACIWLMNLSEASIGQIMRSKGPPLVNVGWGRDLTIRELACIVGEIVGVDCELVFDGSKPDGTPRKLLDTTRLNSLGWHPNTSLREGIRMTYEAYCRDVASDPSSAHHAKQDQIASYKAGT